MTLTVWQKLQILIIRLTIAPLYVFDLVAKYTFDKVYVRAVINLGVVVLIGLFVYLPFKYGSIPQNYSKRINLLHTGLVSEIYGIPQTNTSNSTGHQGVLGSKQQVLRPVLISKKAFPFITAKAHIVVDNVTGKVLSEHNLHRTFAPASTTKLMTALVAVDLYSTREVVEVNPECSAIESTKLWLPVGERFLMKDLMHGLLVGSAADAGCALATYKMSMDSFVELMNEKASEIGMDNTKFTNAIGLDGADGAHYSSVWDLYLLSQRAMGDSLIKKIVKVKDYTFSDINGETNVNVSNTNRLLWDIPETVGIKTGRTSGAGEVLIYKYKDQEKDITIIVMSSENRFLDTRNLLNWTISSYEWQ